MKRKIDTTRIYKVLRFLVLSISVISLLLGLWSSLRFNSASERVRRILHDCLDFNRSVEKAGVENYDLLMDCEADYQDSLSVMRDTEMYGYLFGVGLPILFFGGTALFNYIAPKDKK